MLGTTQPLGANIVRVDGSALVVSRRNDTLTILIAGITKLERSVGRPDRAERSIEAGVVVGLAGLFVGYRLGAHEAGDAAAFARLDDAVLGTLAGAGLGAALGAMLAREHWARVCPTAHDAR